MFITVYRQYITVYYCVTSGDGDVRACIVKYTALNITEFIKNEKR